MKHWWFQKYLYVIDISLGAVSWELKKQEIVLVQTGDGDEYDGRT